MRKSLLMIAAIFAALTINAKEVTVDLSKAAQMAYTDCTGTPSYADGVLTVDYMTPGAWLWAGVEIPINNIAGVKSIAFELKGDGKEIACIPYLRDSEGARWAYNGGESAPSLKSTAWESLSSAPDALMWDAATYKYGEKPFAQLGFIANPAAATTGKFYLKNVKLIVDDATAIDNTAVDAQTTKVIRDGQLFIIRTGVEYNANGQMTK